MTGPEHYHQTEQLLAEANQIIRVGQQPGQSGPADLPERPEDMEGPRRLSSDPGLPDRTIAEAQVHATLALAAATAVAGLGPDSRAWGDVAGTKLGGGHPVKDRHPLAGLPPYGPDHHPLAAGAAACRWRHVRSAGGPNGPLSSCRCLTLS